MTPRQTILNRLYAVMVGLLLVPAGVVAKVVVVQMTDGPELRAAGERQAESYVDLPAQRGLILDASGRVLAQNTARYEIAADPTVAGFAEREAELADLLGRLTGKGAAHVRARIRDRASRQYVLLERSLDEPSKEQLDRAEIPGLLITGSFARRYTYGRTAAHVLGHVDSDLTGKAGMELQLDESLAGTAGRRAVQRDARGRIKAVVGGSVVQPRHGETVVLTLDLVRQSILEEELARGVAEAGAAWGTAIAMDPRSGAILAMANVPTYDPNQPAAVAVGARRNHAVVDRIEPGSTFKLVTAVAALESGAVALSDTIDTGDGWAVFGGRTMRDHLAYGRVSLSEAIKVSSNVAMGRIAGEMGPTPLYRTARAMGFGQPTNIDLPGEVAGSLARPDTWDGTTLAWMSTGYAVEVTPLQLLTAYAALANGGLLVRPHVVAERRDVHGDVVWRAEPDSVRRAFSARTADALRPAFERVVMERGGTGANARVPGLRVAGKTGTAKDASGGGYAGGRYRSSFVGMFPADEPEVVLLVVLSGATNGFYGGEVAAPIFGGTASRWVGTFPTIAQRVAPPQAVPARTEAALPRLAGMPGRLAASRLRADGLAPRLPRDAAWAPVAYDDARAGQTARLDRTVQLDEAAHGGGAATVPDVRGLSTRQALAWLRAAGLQPRLRGTGVVREQSIAPGTALKGSPTITLAAR